jgi:hypothetical protein
MPVCVYSVFVLFCAEIAALQLADPPIRIPTICVKDQETEKAGKVQQRAVGP